MSRDRAIAEALRGANLSTTIRSRRNLSGGCIFNVEALTLDDGQIVVVKSGGGEAETIFREESAGLKALATTNTVLVPEPLGEACVNGHAALLLSYIAPGNADRSSWQSFGRDLARLHSCNVGDRYGFDHDNHIGATPQPNGWMDDWVEFNRVHRLGYQTRLASSRGHLTKPQTQRLDALCDQLEKYIPRRPKPALLHGDLWSGNALPTECGRIAVIDPAVYIGDGWADIAMMQLFGGFYAECINAYRELNDDQENLAERIAVYQLYHLLNHVNLFGGGYVSQAIGLLGRLGA